MHIAQTNNRPTLNRAIKRALICSLIVLTALGALAARSLFKERQVTAEIEVTLCKKNARGGWDIVDEAKGSPNFKASPAEALKGKINTDHRWNFTSNKGHQVSVSLERAGSFEFILDRTNPKLAELKFQLPFHVEYDGKRISRIVDLSTASVSTPIGPLGGKKARFEGEAAIAEELVGLVKIKASELLEAAAAKDRAEEFVLVLKIKNARAQ